MVKNQIMQAQPQNTAAVTRYMAGDSEVLLDFETVKRFLVTGDADKVTDKEVMTYIKLCEYNRLNPFLKEAHLIKYGNNDATMVVGKDTYIKRASRNPNYVGKKSGIIVQLPDGTMEKRDGCFYGNGEFIVGGWAEVYVKGREVPEYAAVSFNEYAGRKSDGSLNKQWSTKPATMINKVAIVHALREAFPEDLSGMYEAEEVGMDAVPETVPVEVQPMYQQYDSIPVPPPAEPDFGEIMNG